VNGGNLYRKTSFLVDSLGSEVFSRSLRIEERPFERQGAASAPFDDEGVGARERTIVRDGVLQGYFLGSYSSRKLGMATTGNAGGAHNLVVTPGADDFDALLRRMGRGLLITEQLGQGVNPVTGDFSRGAAGFWVEDGVIAYPVEEITIAGNLKDMYRNISAIANDLVLRLVGLDFDLFTDFFSFVVDFDFADEFGVAIELRIGKETCRLRVVEDVEIEFVVFATDAGTAADDLLELGERVDGLIEDDEFAGLGINPSRQEF